MTQNIFLLKKLRPTRIKSILKINKYSARNLLTQLSTFQVYATCAQSVMTDERLSITVL